MHLNPDVFRCSHWEKFSIKHSPGLFNDEYSSKWSPWDTVVHLDFVIFSFLPRHRALRPAWCDSFTWHPYGSRNCSHISSWCNVQEDNIAAPCDDNFPVLASSADVVICIISYFHCVPFCCILQRFFFPIVASRGHQQRILFLMSLNCMYQIEKSLCARLNVDRPVPYIVWQTCFHT